MHQSISRLLQRPQWAQRTPEWYEVRKTLLTASDAAAALGVPPYKSYPGDPRRDLLTKKLENRPLNNVYVLHGQRYEDEARDLAMSALGEEAIDVGLFRHPTYEWLGASPDGVTKSGLCIEIKCPLSREIIPGVIPHHYYPQIQVQMEVCDLESTIFIQYKPPVVSRTKAAELDIVKIERDRDWFEANVESLRTFYEEYSRRKETFVPTDIPNDRGCLIDDALYDEK